MNIYNWLIYIVIVYTQARTHAYMCVCVAYNVQDSTSLQYVNLSDRKRSKPSDFDKPTPSVCYLNNEEQTKNATSLMWDTALDELKLCVNYQLHYLWDDDDYDSKIGLIIYTTSGPKYRT